MLRRAHLFRLRFSVVRMAKESPGERAIRDVKQKHLEAECLKLGLPYLGNWPSSSSVWHNATTFWSGDRRPFVILPVQSIDENGNATFKNVPFMFDSGAPTGCIPFEVAHSLRLSSNLAGFEEPFIEERRKKNEKPLEIGSDEYLREWKNFIVTDAGQTWLENLKAANMNENGRTKFGNMQIKVNDEGNLHALPIELGYEAHRNVPLLGADFLSAQKMVVTIDYSRTSISFHKSVVDAWVNFRGTATMLTPAVRHIDGLKRALLKDPGLQGISINRLKVYPPSKDKPKQGDVAYGEGDPNVGDVDTPLKATSVGKPYHVVVL